MDLQVGALRAMPIGTSVRTPLPCSACHESSVHQACPSSTTKLFAGVPEVIEADHSVILCDNDDNGVWTSTTVSTGRQA